MKVIRRYCPTCEAKRPFEKPEPNWLLHVVLAVLTLGIWIVPLSIGLAWSWFFTPWRCRTCGYAKR